MSELVQKVSQALEAIEAAGLKVYRYEGKKSRVYQPGRTGAYVILEGGYSDAVWANYVEPKEGGESTKCSGAFHARIRDILAAQREAIRAAATGGA